MAEDSDYLIGFEDAHDFLPKFRFLTYILTGSSDATLIRYWRILWISVVEDCETQTELAKKVGCSQPTISREIPIIRRIWNDTSSLYSEFIELLRDDHESKDEYDFKLKVLQDLLAGKLLTEIVSPTGDSGDSERDAKELRKVSKMLKRLFKERQTLRDKLRHYSPLNV